MGDRSITVSKEKGKVINKRLKRANLEVGTQWVVQHSTTGVLYGMWGKEITDAIAVYPIPFHPKTPSTDICLLSFAKDQHQLVLFLSRALETSQCCSPLLLETTCGQSSIPVLPPATFYAVWSPLNHQQSPTSNFLNSRGIYEMGFPRSQLQNTFISNHHPLSNINFDFGTH